MIRGFVPYTKSHRWPEEEEDDEREETKGGGREGEGEKMDFLVPGGLGTVLRYRNNAVSWKCLGEAAWPAYADRISLFEFEHTFKSNYEPKLESNSNL